MLYCGLDTETTGLPNRGLDAKNENQARVLQLALKLVTIEGRVISQFSSLIQPNGWREIHPKAFEAHGITKEDCEKFGIGAEKAFWVFRHYADLADMIVAHNADFDKGMMEIESKALGIDMPKIDWHCTMKQATPICKVPPTDAMVRAGRTHYKNANLTEALKIICGEDLEGAHDAMVDVTACVKIFLAMQNGQKRAQDDDVQAALDWLVRLYKYAQTTHDSAAMRDQIDFWYTEVREALIEKDE